MAINSIHIPKQTGVIDFPPCEVTWTPLPSDLRKYLGPDHSIFSSYYEKLPSLKTLEAFREKYPSRSEINNLLTYGYIKKRKVKKANALIKENYRLNPTHLLSQINYADLCLRQNALADIPKIKIPKKMHISEFRAYTILMANYHLKLGEKEKAEAYHYLVHRLDPNHISTQHLKTKVYPISYGQVWKIRLKKLLRL
ncbi:MAG: hypothetical protein P0S94_00710 [Simkaniaceae bacterium]|nr:hypothetical protein [Simkaniaceae bacterium]